MKSEQSTTKRRAKQTLQQKTIKILETQTLVTFHYQRPTLSVYFPKVSLYQKPNWLGVLKWKTGKKSCIQ